MERVLLITLSGEDQPGLTCKVSGILATQGVSILDIGQAVIHSTLSLGILVEWPGESRYQDVRDNLSAVCAEAGMAVNYRTVSARDYQHWVDAQGRPRHIVTLLARKISAQQLMRVTDVINRHGLNIDRINRLSGRIPLGELARDSKACVELSIRGGLTDTTAFRSDLLELATELEVDLALQRDSMYRRNRRLVVFDMDSTLITAEVIDELAIAAGVGDQVAQITEQAMRGELDFNASFKARVALLKGLDVSVLEGIAQNLCITEGAENLITTLRKLGYKTAILSGGFTYFARYLQQRLGIDYIHANALDTREGKVTGEVVEPIVDGARKALLLKEIAENEGVALEQVIAVGDGANDLPMLAIAGLGVAFRAKPLVKQSAEQSISTLGLDAILYLLGFSDRYQDELADC